MEKGVSSMVSSVIVVLITVTGISVVLMVGLPALEHSRASASLGEAQGNMIVLDNAIRQAASEGLGSVKEVAIDVREGSYRAVDDGILYRTQAPDGFLEGSSVIVDGEVRLNLTYSNISLSGGARLGPGLQKMCIRKAGQNSTHVLLNATSC